MNHDLRIMHVVCSRDDLTNILSSFYAYVQDHVFAGILSIVNVVIIDLKNPDMVEG